jgi:hypothetical protein
LARVSGRVALGVGASAEAHPQDGEQDGGCPDRRIADERSLEARHLGWMQSRRTRDIALAQAGGDARITQLPPKVDDEP